MWISEALHEALPRVQCPVHGIWGERDMADRALLDLRIAALRQARPDARVEVIPGAGHWVFYEAADRFNAALLGILKR